MEEEKIGVPQPQGDKPRKRKKRKKKGGSNQNGQAVQGVQNNQNNRNHQNGQNGQGNNQNRNNRSGEQGKKGQNPNLSGQKKGEKPAKPAPQQQQPQQQSKKQKNKKGANHNAKDTYAYLLDGNLYINLTNKCSNGCDFCVRNERSSYYGHSLWLQKEDPTAEKVIAAIQEKGDPSGYNEIVFCGFGEPTYKMEEMLAVAEYAHSIGKKTRLNTNGQGCLINKRDIVPEIKGKIDFVNVSLNAPDAESYQKVCRSQYGEDGYTAMIEFAKALKRNGVACRLSVVDYIGEESVAACKAVAEKTGVPLYVRNYITDSE